ncbi:hypothetical protein [Gorillibacterium sp. sgz500922]|uniref:hypothetical protein n=1 Tax=Gorillibacterium sp. sgz500922 TaxID=3446694 RepID=UPI003F67167C
MLESGLHDILQNFDFTDSIVTEVKWADNLIDLIVNVDYYWDLQEGRDTTRVLKLVFKECIRADFQLNTELPLLSNKVNIDSLFTIVLIKELSEQETITDKQIRVGIFTADYSKPWLSVVCTNVILEE